MVERVRDHSFTGQVLSLLAETSGPVSPDIIMFELTERFGHEYGENLFVDIVKVLDLAVTHGRVCRLDSVDGPQYILLR